MISPVKSLGGGFIIGKVCGCYTLLTLVRFYLVIDLADFSGDIMFCDRDLVRERDLGERDARNLNRREH